METCKLVTHRVSHEKRTETGLTESHAYFVARRFVTRFVDENAWVCIVFSDGTSDTTRYDNKAKIFIRTFKN